MKIRLVTYALAGLASLAVACGPAPAPPVTSTAPAARAVTLHFELAGSADATDIPRLIAMDSLREQGYAVSTLEYENDSLLFVAMQRGELDFATVADVVGWNAIGSGAPASIVLDESALTLLILAADEIQECADLDGQPVGIGSVHGANATLLYQYIARECPDAKPNYLSISGSANRLAALLGGEVTATTMELYDYVALPPEQQAGIHALVMLEDVFPGLTTISLFMRRGLAEEYPETAKDVIRAILEARRRIQDPQVLTDELVRRLELDPALARTTAETFLEHEIWDVNGAYTLGFLQKNYEFYVAAGAVPAGIRVEDVADLSYLEAVLGEIGRQ